MIKFYEVYIVKLKQTVVYCGSGLKGRHKHATSGISHSYALNKLHFEHSELVTVHVIQNNLTQDRSLELELELIQHYKPPYNKKDNEKYNSKWIPIQYFEDKVNSNDDK